MTELHYFQLKAAFLCLDCDCVGNSACYCPVCCSTSLLSLAKLLNRAQEIAQDATPSDSLAPRSVQEAIHG